MFACTGFKPWTKEKIIKRLKENGLIEENASENIIQEETEYGIVKQNLIPIVYQLIGKEYNTYLIQKEYGEKEVTLRKRLSFKEWLKTIL
jgi:hypothetical protein